MGEEWTGREEREGEGNVKSEDGFVAVCGENEMR